MKYFALRTRRLLAFIAGAVYVFSGISKLLDPVDRIKKIVAKYGQDK